MTSLVSVSSLDHSIRPSSLAKHLAETFRYSIRPLPPSKVSTFVENLLIHDRSHGMPPTDWVIAYLDWKISYSQRAVDVALDYRQRDDLGVLQSFVINV